MSGEEEGFLARWSRRKRQAAALPRDGEPPEPDPAPAPISALPPAAEGELPPPAAEAPAPAEAPEDMPADLPPLESLTAGSDITPFLRPQVPAALRQAALRRLWSLDPAIRDFVGPADYAWDYNAPGGVPGFALELGGEARRLLAQAIGLGPEPEDGRRDAPPAPEATAPAAAPEEPLSPPESVPPEPEPRPSAPAALADGSTEPAPEPGEAEPPIRRRHGGARPA